MQNMEEKKKPELKRPTEVIKQLRDKATSKRKELESARKQYESETKKLKSEVDNLENARKQYEQEISIIRKQHEGEIHQLKDRIKELEAGAAVAPVVQEESGELHELIETLTLEKEIAEENVEALSKENEELKSELAVLKEEIELRNLEMEQLQAEDEEHGQINVDELKLALKRLYNEYQNASANYENKIHELENQVASIPSLEQKVASIQDLKKQLESKDRDIADLKDALEETGGFQDMIENLTDENLRLSEKVQQLEQSIEELQELHEIQEQMIEDQGEIEKELNDELHNKEVEIQRMMNDRDRWEDEKNTLEQVIHQFRNKLQEQQGEINMLRDELNNTGEEEKTHKMQDLIERNFVLIGKIRELKANSMNARLTEIQALISKEKCDYILQAVPKDLLIDLNLNAFNIFMNMKLTREKALLLHKELVFRTLETVPDKTMMRWITQLSTITINYIITISTFEEKIAGMTCEKYQEILKAQEWGHITLISSFLDNYLKLIREESLSTNISLESYQVSVDALMQFRNSELGSESVRIYLGRALLFAELGVSILESLYGFRDVNTLDIASKCDGLVEKLIHTKLDEETEQLRSIAEIMNARYGAVYSVLTSDQIAGTYYWKEWFEGIEREIKNVGNLVKFNSDVQSGPWSLIAEKIKLRLETFERTFKELEESKETIKTYVLKIAMLEKEIQDFRISKSNLETRLADAHAKSQKLTQLEIEKKRLQDREKYFQESIDSMSNDNDKLQNKIKDLEEEVKKLKEKEDEIPSMKITSSLASAESGMRKGNPLALRGSLQQFSHEDIDLYKGIIENIQAEKMQKFTGHLHSQLRYLPDFPSLQPTVLPRKMNEMISLKNNLQKKASALKIVDLSMQNSFNQLR